MPQQILGTVVKALAKSAMKKKAKSSMTKKAAVAAGASNEMIGSLPKRPRVTTRDEYKAAMKDYKKAPARKKAAEKRAKSAMKSINKKPLPKRSRSGRASGR